MSEVDKTEDNVKYTCRYDIQIDNEKEFQVARRVIGSKGANMKRIIEECSQSFDQSVNPYEVVKLRLRGKGSGFKEGPNQEESTDPLNLCISSKYKDKYDYACREIEKLLLKVYEEFYYFYLNKHRKPALWGKKLDIIKEETVTQPKVFDQFDDASSYSATQSQSQLMNSFQPQAYMTTQTYFGPQGSQQPSYFASSFNQSASGYQNRQGFAPPKFFNAHN